MKQQIPQLPKEALEALVEYGFDRETLEDIDNIDFGTVSVDLNTNIPIVTYAIYIDKDSDDIMEVEVESKKWRVSINKEEILSGECDYDIDVEREEAIMSPIIQID